ncbi:phage tail protein [Hymenobacter baengnokdamensis]|uniref:phage tail protein n=1 Tax=Hymenobacter baengnokdamensis TaxID=2615203 RepID=UPI001E4ECC72|nr:phage tail protein [Hymenobacter baengnokdamensis]
MKKLTTQANGYGAATPALPSSASRRNWLKGLSALLGTGLLAAPAALLAAPASSGTLLLPAGAALAGGDEYIGMVKLLAGAAVPAGWTPCDGRLLPVAEHPALFALLNYTYGGDGRTLFALPKLGGVTPAGTFCAIKMANGPATTTALTELRLLHQRQTQARVA